MLILCYSAQKFPPLSSMLLAYIKDLCLKLDHSIRVYSINTLTVLLEYIN